MRLSSLVVAVVFLFSSAVFSQHSSTSSAPSSPPPSPPPSAAPSSPTHTPPPSPSPSVSSSPAPSVPASPTMSHNSAPSTPSPARIPESHVAPTPGSAGSHVSSSSFSDSSAGKTASPVRSPDSDAGRVIPGEKLSGNEGRIVAAPRIGETTLTKEEKDNKNPTADLRRRICPNGSCKEPEPNPGEADLRRRICPNGSCVQCPPGHSAGKNGNCVTTPAPATTAYNCQPNEYWNGSSCAATNRCRAGESWNGAECVSPGQCAMFSSRGDLLAVEARSIRRDMEVACSNDPYGQECMRLTQSHDGAVQRYEMLMNEAPVNCRTMLSDPLSL